LGKLRDLRDRREQMEWDDHDRISIEEEINKIEQWCIDNNNGFVTKLTKWSNNNMANNTYPWHTGYIEVKDTWMVASLNGKGLNYNKDKTIHFCENCS
jgi:predicted phosphatase